MKRVGGQLGERAPPLVEEAIMAAGGLARQRAGRRPRL
jgi:hypothetical protein